MRHYCGLIFLPQVPNAICDDEPRSGVQMGQATRHHSTHQRGADVRAGMVENRSSEMSIGMHSPRQQRKYAELRGAVQYKGSLVTRSIRCSEYPRRPNRRPPGQADPPFQPRTKVGKSKFTAWRRRLSRLGAFIWEKWWRVFWAILFWLAFLRSLTTLGLSGVELVISDAHQGLKNAIAAMFAGASWQRCRTHFMANLLTRVPKRALLSLSKGRRGYPGPSSHGTHHLPATVSRRGPRPTRPSGGTTPGGLSPGGRAAGGRRAGHPGLHGLPSGPLAEAVVQQPAGTAEPGDKAPQSLPPKGDVVVFPNRLSARRLVGAVLAEQHDEWAEARRYLTIPNAAGNEALPTPNMLDAAA